MISRSALNRLSSRTTRKDRISGRITLPAQAGAATEREDFKFAGPGSRDSEFAANSSGGPTDRGPSRTAG